jgi:hypothetical protein
MANICTIQITMTSNKKTLDWMESELKKIKEIESGEDRDLTFIDTFGNEGKFVEDKVGSKWLRVDFSTLDRRDEESLFLQVESANHLPESLLINLNQRLKNKSVEINNDEEDYETSVDGRYWDEVFQPIGLFSVYGNEVMTDEAYLDNIDFEDENYWDKQVEPEFDNLEV